MNTTRIAAAILWRGDELLLVEQVSGGRRYWSLPGGVVDADETLHDGLRREVLEETGVEILSLAGVSHVTETWTGDHLYLATIFDVANWKQGLRSADPSGEVIRAEFVERDQAVSRLAALPYRAMAEPILQHLDDSGRPCYAYRDRGGVQTEIGGGDVTTGVEEHG
jgi:ADP-ribose pyrophosphatase YjhB (NUDIX family)